MNGTTKFIVGAVATSLMAMASHSLIGLGGGFIDGLTTSAKAAVASGGVPGVDVAFVHEPAYERVAILSGPATPEQREKLLAAVRAIPGVKDARWAVDAAPATAPAVNTDQTPATAEAVKNCQADVDAVITGKTINFDSGAATIKAESQALIDALAAELGQCAGTTVEVAGHTDTTGGDAANLALSEARAGSVVAALVAKGTPAERFAPKGYGQTKPKMPGSDEAANAANRRIEFAVASAAAPAATGGQ